MYSIARRGCEIVIAATALVLLSPFLLLLAGLIAIKMGTPVFFKQHRIGKDGRVFNILKFRTMRHAQTPAVWSSSSDAVRLVPLGLWMRRWSLDELPQLWNILTGDMGLIGPRPLPVEYRDRYSPAEWHRHDVRPGLTGLAQVRGRNALSWTDRLQTDLEYVKRYGLGVDARILRETINVVFSGRGISVSGGVTMTELPPFNERAG